MATYSRGLQAVAQLNMIPGPAGRLLSRNVTIRLPSVPVPRLPWSRAKAQAAIETAPLSNGNEDVYGVIDTGNSSAEGETRDSSAMNGGGDANVSTTPVPAILLQVCIAPLLTKPKFNGVDCREQRLVASCLLIYRICCLLMRVLE